LLLFSVSAVLSLCGDSEVCLSVVEAVLIYVVDDHSGRHFDYVSVHKVCEVWFVVGALSCPLCIICSSGRGCYGMPFVSGQLVIIVRVNDCEFAPCQWYSAKGMAEADSAVKQQRPDERRDKGNRHFQSYSNFCKWQAIEHLSNRKKPNNQHHLGGVPAGRAFLSSPPPLAELAHLVQ